MRYGIIAAGEGSRLAAEGVGAPKPLVEVCGQPLIDRLIDIFMDQQAEEIAVICNDLTPWVSQHLAEINKKGLHGRTIPLRLKVKSTPSSMHSFYELSEYLQGGPFVLTTVDTIFKPTEFSSYVAKFKELLGQGYDGLMGVTDFIDDEKPLYVGTDEQMDITGFFDTNDHDCRYVSAGIYGLTPKAIDTLHYCMERGESRMRNFQRGLIRDGRRLKAFNFSKVLDIDHASDIAKAESFLQSVQ
jgi:NDP-sugar pyrophosphorylase family protein